MGLYAGWGCVWMGVCIWETYIWDNNWATKLSGVYSGGLIYGGRGVSTGLYGIS